VADVLEHDLRKVGTGASPAAPAQALPGLISAFRSKADGVAEELAVDRPIVEDADGWLWLHFNLADARACHFLRSTSYLPLTARALLVAADAGRLPAPATHYNARGGNCGYTKT